MSSPSDPALVFVGSLNDDTVALVPRLPRADERIEAAAIARSGGGNAATSAAAAALLGAPAAFVGPVARDAAGERLVEELRTVGVDVSGLVPVEPSAAGASVVLIDAVSAERSICVRPPEPFGLTSQAARLVAGAAWVHVDQSGWSAVSSAAVRPATARLSVDAGNPVAGLDLRGVELYGPTLAALRSAYGPGLSRRELVDAALADGARCVVVTDGAAGAFGRARGGAWVQAPGVGGLEVRSTLGAGDAFHGTLLVALWRGNSLARAMAYACAAAALSCRGLDARSGLPTHAEVEALLAPTSSPTSSPTPTSSPNPGGQ